MSTKICTRAGCIHGGAPQPLDNFDTVRAAKDGKAYHCKDCRREMQRTASKREAVKDRQPETAPVAPPAAVSPKTKTCKACLQEKPLDHFSRNSGCADGREGKCKLCRSTEKRAYRSAKAQGNLKAQLKATAAPQPDALAVQVGGSHYKHFAIQPIEFSTKNRLGFIQGDIVKRICRYNLPGGKGIQDLEKIKHEVDCLIAIEGLGGAHV